MSKVDVCVGGEVYLALEVPEDCTVGHWKKCLGDGTIGDKILYAAKLSCREEEKGKHLQDTAPLPSPPSKMFVEGPGSVVRMLQLALRKKRPPQPGPQRHYPPPKALEKRFTSYASAAAHAVGSHQIPQLTSEGAGKELRFFCQGMQGMRPYMEDRTCGLLQLPGYDNAAFFGVFDGHGGHEVAELAVELLPSILSSALSSQMDPSDALSQAFQQLDSEIYSAAKGLPQSFDRVGSTAVVTLLLREAGQLRLLCANCGDSRAVLCREGHAMDLSEDQKPQNPEERRRIQAAGGNVTQIGPCWRIDAGLNLSRAIGDFAYKANPEKSSSEQMVISVPQIRETIITSLDQFVVMGSDGVYDVLSSEALVQHLRKAHQLSGSWPDAIESALKESLSGGDNVTLCLVEFVHSQ